MNVWREFEEAMRKLMEEPPVTTPMSKELYHLNSREAVRCYVEDCLADPHNMVYCTTAVTNLLKTGSKLPPFEEALDMWWAFLPKPGYDPKLLGPCSGLILNIAMHFCMWCQLCLARERM